MTDINILNTLAKACGDKNGWGALQHIYYDGETHTLNASNSHMLLQCPADNGDKSHFINKETFKAFDSGYTFPDFKDVIKKAAEQENAIFEGNYTLYKNPNKTFNQAKEVIKICNRDKLYDLKYIKLILEFLNGEHIKHCAENNNLYIETESGCKIVLMPTRFTESELIQVKTGADVCELYKQKSVKMKIVAILNDSQVLGIFKNTKDAESHAFKIMKDGDEVKYHQTVEY